MNKSLTFSACAGDVFWNTGLGGTVYCSPTMVGDLRQMMFQEALDGAQLGDVNLVRSANRMLQQLNAAQDEAKRWRQTARISA